MNVIDAIRARRSIGKVKPDLPPRELIETLLDAATHAPNHHKVQPWRFFVLTGAGRDRLAEVMAQVEADKHVDPTTETAQKAIAGARAKAYRAPVIIVMAVEPPQAAKVIMEENIQAVAAAAQNMLLTAHDLGLGAMWRSGDVAFDARSRAMLGLGVDWFIAGFIYVGYPDGDPGGRQRTSFADKTVWWGDSEGAYGSSTQV